MQRCRICQSEVYSNPRYPRAVCVSCAARAKSADGRALLFFNISFSGGFIARYADTQEEYPDHRCYIDGILCWADEEYMGSIVVQVIDTEPLDA
jgi:hypothetical protein